MDDAGNDQENDLEEVIIGQDFRGSYRFSEVVGVYTCRNLIFFIKAWLYKWAEVGVLLASGLRSA